jgi:trk system potassium uptake protein TrkA
MILNGDGADGSLLTEEGVEYADGDVAATESDEVNLMYGAIAKSMGVNKCVAVVRHKRYLDMPGRIPIDAVVNPNETLASVILRYVRYPGDSKALSIIEKIDAEMLEIVLPEGHVIENVPLMECSVPKGILVALVGRGARVFVPDGSTRLLGGDHVILFASTPKMRAAAEFFG